MAVSAIKWLLCVDRDLKWDGAVLCGRLMDEWYVWRCAGIVQSDRCPIVVVRGSLCTRPPVPVLFVAQSRRWCPRWVVVCPRWRIHPSFSLPSILSDSIAVQVWRGLCGSSGMTYGHGRLTATRESATHTKHPLLLSNVVYDVFVVGPACLVKANGSLTGYSLIFLNEVRS